ncbi:MAG: SH3 domain-containing protein [Acidobacteria bacterium]|nr:SH3 domain-containing protein [Acidobacteriota bacterium]
MAGHLATALRSAGRLACAAGWILFVLCALLATARPVSADWLVYRDGTRLETVGEWKIDGKHVVFSLPNGMLSTVKLEELNLDASRKLTRSQQSQQETPSQRGRTDDGQTGRAARDTLASTAASGRREYPSATVRARPCLNLHPAPRSDAPVLDCVADGTSVEMLARRGGWTQVRTHDGYRGWLSSDYLVSASPNPQFKSAMVLTDADVGHIAPARPTDSSDPKAEPAAREQGLMVTGWERDDAEVGGTMIVGFLRNLSDRVSTSIVLTVRVLDQELNPMLEQPAKLDTTILAPGQTTRFEALLDRVFSFRELEFETSSTDLDTASPESSPRS